MSPGTLLTHAPMDKDVLPDHAYFHVLLDVADSLDFIMVQYYNGVTRPAKLGIKGVLPGRSEGFSAYDI